MKSRLYGYTLIELIVVLIILSLGLTTLLLALRQATFNNTSSQFLTVAQGLAQGKMEQIISDRKNQATGFSYIVNSNYPSEATVSGFKTYTRSVSIFYVNLAALDTQVAGPTDYKRVAVTVSGPASQTVVRLVTLVTNW